MRINKFFILTVLTCWMCHSQSDTLTHQHVAIKTINNTFKASTLTDQLPYSGYYSKSDLELHFYDAGFLKHVYLFNKDNKSIKRFLNYTTEGILIEEGKFKNHFKIGDWNYYHKFTGKLTCTGSFFNNKKTRKWKYFDENKKLVRTEVYRNDNLTATYFHH